MPDQEQPVPLGSEQFAEGEFAELTRSEREFAANRARLQQLATDADEKKAEFYERGDKNQAQYYAGWRDGLLRAVRVIEGQG